MIAEMAISYLNRAEIDDVRWDEMIRKYSNGLPYPLTWYLDLTAHGQWDALIVNGYEGGMPLPWNKKLFGYRQLYQPFWTQQLGWFGDEMAGSDFLRIISLLQENFRLIHVHLNHDLSSSHGFGNYGTKTNLILDLSSDYDAIHHGYQKSLRKRLKKTKSLALEKLEDPALVVNFYKAHLNDKIGLPDSAYTVMKKLVSTAISNGAGAIWAVKHPVQGYITIGFFLINDRRVINLFGASNETGKALFGMHRLLDGLIEKYSNTNMLFDFEGSEIPGVAAFFRSFGATEANYAVLKINNLPSWVNRIMSVKEKIRNK